jgi:hypothetical protein
MRFDLRGQTIGLKTERRDECGAECRPIDLRQCDHMCVEITDRAVHFAENGDPSQPQALRLKPRRDIGHFLADGRRRRGLAMGTGQHGGAGVVCRKFIQHAAETLEHRQQQRCACVLEHERIGEVVDIFRCAPEVQPFKLCRRRAARMQFAAQPILDRLDVMVGTGFDLFDRRDVGRIRIFTERPQQFACRGRQRGQCVHGGTRRQRQKPGAFDANAFAHQSGLAEYPAHIGELAGIAAVERR